jgi:hypothetical protein
MIAHVGGLPVEEALLSMGGGAGAGLVLARGWIVARLRRRRERPVNGPRRTSSHHS